MIAKRFTHPFQIYCRHGSQRRSILLSFASFSINLAGTAKEIPEFCSHHSGFSGKGFWFESSIGLPSGASLGLKQTSGNPVCGLRMGESRLPSSSPMTFSLESKTGPPLLRGLETRDSIYKR